MELVRDNTKPIKFSSSRIKRVIPTLARSEGYQLSPQELKKIFGIDQRRFADIPNRLVVPVLFGRHHKEHWYRTSGKLYILEPQKWVPTIVHGRTMPISSFKTSYSKTARTVSENTFNAGCQAEVSFEAGGSFYGITASAKTSTDISLRYSSTTTTEETIKTDGVTGNKVIHELSVYPVLRCKVIKWQPIDYTINDRSDELKWDEKMYDNPHVYWKRIWVDPSRVESFQRLCLHPVPIQDGEGLGGKAYMLPLPQVKADGELDVVTLLKRTGWEGWYIYEKGFRSGLGDTIDLAAPNNDVAFTPMSTWTTLVSLANLVHTL
jgi:hypothetical protein